MIVYSFPDDFDRPRAKALLEKALHGFALLAKDSPPTDRRQTAVSFRAYFGAPARLTITRRRRRATIAKYRGDAKFSHAFKPNGMKTDERVALSLDVT
jgi:trimethylamine:corrinoid methyltransferase-like protein